VRRLAGVAVAAAALALSGHATARSASLAPLVAAHRGGAALGPENSVLAFRQALALGVDALELDVHLSADGEVVVLHDATLDRTTTGRGPVREATSAALASLRLRTRDGHVTDEAIPTLAQVLDLAAPARVAILPEIKAAPDGRPYPGIEEKVLALIGARGLLARATVQAFAPETIERVRALAPGVRTMLLVGRGRMKGARAAPAMAVQWAVDSGATDLGIDHRLVDRSVVDAARKASVRLAVWTVNDAADMRRMIDLGVDVIMTDRPDLLRRIVGR
jgi:glycerophosphoryl diester phosphodiesterase